MAEVGSLFIRLRAQAKEFEDALEGVGQKISGLGGGMKDIGGDLTRNVTAPILAVGAGSLAAAIDFESAFAGVRKTVDGTEGDFERLETGIRDMAGEIPASATAIAGVAEVAGQLGIETSNILGFTRVMIDLGESTNLSSEEAASALARLANITQMPQDQFGNLGSTVVALGNNLATTESDIVSMGLRLSGAGAQIGLSEAEILGFAGALSSVGIESEAGGSAFSKVMVDMANAVATGSEDLDKFAEAAGMSTEDFAKLFQEDAAGAVIAFTEGLGKISEEGGNVFGVLEDLGFDQIRVRDALLRSAGAGDLMRESIALGTEAWEENSALTKEAEQRYATTASQLRIVKNQAMDVAISFGQQLLPVLRDQIMPAVVTFIGFLGRLVEWFSNLSPRMQTVILVVAGLAAAIGPLLVVFGTLLGAIGLIVANFGIVIAVVGAIVSPVGLVVLAIAALVAAFVIAYQTSETFRDIVHGAIDAVRVVVEEVVGLVSDLLDGDWSGAWERASGWVTSAVEAIEDALPGIWDAISTFITETAPKFAQKLLDWGVEFVSWIAPQIPPLLAEAGKLLLAVTGWILEAIPKIGLQLAKWGIELIAWVGPQIPPLLLELGKLLDEIGEWIVFEGVPTLVTKLAEWGSAAIGWVAKDAIPYIVPELWLLANKINDWIHEEALPSIVSHLVAWGSAFFGWIARDAIPFIADKLFDLLGAITKWIVDEGVPGLVSAAADLGTGIVEGIWQGIKDATGWLVEKLTGWVEDNIPGPIKKALELLSPSRVMARIGEEIPAGLALGIESQLGDVAAAARNMASVVSMTEIGLPGVPDLSMSGAGGMGGSMDSGGMELAVQNSYRIMIGDREIEDFVVEIINDHMRRRI